VERSRQKRTQEAAAQNREALGKHGTNQHGEDITKTETVMFSRQGEGNRASYRIRRLRRDHPDVARRLDAGEFRSGAAAGRRGVAHGPLRVVRLLRRLKRRSILTPPRLDFLDAGSRLSHASESPGNVVRLTRSKEGQVMGRFSDAVFAFLADESGPTAVEYAVMLALIIVVCIVAITTLGTNATSTFSNVALNQAAGGGGS
jgi:pilus assembly protein Flp/PilA